MKRDPNMRFDFRKQENTNTQRKVGLGQGREGGQGRGLALGV